MTQARTTDSLRPGGRLRLRAGRVYRRKDLANQSTAIDRDLQLALNAGRLYRAAQGLYYAPIKTPFGDAPPSDQAMVEKFLGDKDFLLFSPNNYNSLCLGTTQLYNLSVVYNHKRHGRFPLGNRVFDFRVKPAYPRQLNEEFLWVDMLNNLDDLAEDTDMLLVNARASVGRFDKGRLKRAMTKYGSEKTKRLTRGWLDV